MSGSWDGRLGLHHEDDRELAHGWVDGCVG